MATQIPETIDVIEQVLDTPALLSAIAVGCFVGAVALYVYQTYHKGLVKSIQDQTLKQLIRDTTQNDVVPESDEVRDYDAEQQYRLAQFGQQA